MKRYRVYKGSCSFLLPTVLLAHHVAKREPYKLGYNLGFRAVRSCSPAEC